MTPKSPSNAGKVFLSAGFILASIAYAILQQPDKDDVPIAAATPTASAPQPVAPPAPAPAASSAHTSAATTAGAPQGQYADGTYTGAAENAYYGTVQVQAVVSGGKLADVQFLQHPYTHANSVFINDQAMPLLTKEALAAQSAQVDGVSGATFTSEAFKQSLASALAQAAP
jgi:uncharacterized protein with FMN-binding domain